MREQQAQWWSLKAELLNIPVAYVASLTAWLVWDAYKVVPRVLVSLSKSMTCMWVQKTFAKNSFCSLFFTYVIFSSEPFPLVGYTSKAAEYAANQIHIISNCFYTPRHTYVTSTPLTMIVSYNAVKMHDD